MPNYIQEIDQFIADYFTNRGVVLRKYYALGYLPPRWQAVTVILDRVIFFLNQHGEVFSNVSNFRLGNVDKRGL